MKILKRIALYGVLGLAALSFIYPFLWMASATFKPLTEIGTLSLIPDHAPSTAVVWLNGRLS